MCVYFTPCYNLVTSTVWHTKMEATNAHCINLVSLRTYHIPWYVLVTFMTFTTLALTFFVVALIVYTVYVIAYVVGHTISRPCCCMLPRITSIYFFSFSIKMLMSTSLLADYTCCTTTCKRIAYYIPFVTKKLYCHHGYVFRKWCSVT